MDLFLPDKTSVPLSLGGRVFYHVSDTFGQTVKEFFDLSQ